MPTNLFQRVGDFFEQRKQFRAAALTALRKREGLPEPIDEHGVPLETRFDDVGNATYHNAAGEKVDRVLFAGGRIDGKPGAFATGTRKQESEFVFDEFGVGHAVPTAAVSDAWGRESEFKILEVSEDGKPLSNELRDLNRDAGTFEIAERVSHGPAGEQAPGLEMYGTSDEEADRALQEYLKRGKS